MVTIVRQNFVGNVTPGDFLSSHTLRGEIVVDNVKKGDVIEYTLQGYKFNDNGIVKEEGTNRDVGKITLIGNDYDDQLSHTSDNPPTTTKLKYVIRFTSDLPNGTTIYTYSESSSNNSMSNKDYQLEYYVKEGTSNAKTVLSTPVTIPKKTTEPAVDGFLLAFTNVSYTEGKLDPSPQRTAFMFAMSTSFPAGTLFEVTVPLDHLKITDKFTVGKTYQAGATPYTTASSPVNSYGVYQKDPDSLPFEVVSVDKTTGKIVFKNTKQSKAGNKYAIDVGTDIYIKDFKYVYDLTNTKIKDAVTGVIKSAGGARLSNSADDLGDLSHLRTKKNSRADIPYVPEPEPEPKPEPNPEPKPEPTPPPPLKPVMDCIDCSCEQLTVGWNACAGLHEMNDTKLAGAARVITDTAFCDYPRVLPKVLHGIWCLMRNNLAQLCWMLAQLEKVYKALEKLLQDLKGSGAWVQTGPTIFDGDLAPNRHLATGNINLFGGTPDGPHFIRTNSGSTEDDLAGGI